MVARKKLEKEEEKKYLEFCKNSCKKYDPGIDYSAVVKFLINQRGGRK